VKKTLTDQDIEAVAGKIIADGDEKKPAARYVDKSQRQQG